MAATTTITDDALLMRLEQAIVETPDIGYRKAWEKLKAEPPFANVSLKRVQTALQKLREQHGKVPVGFALENAKKVPGSAGPGENIQTAAGDGDIERVRKLMDMEGFTPTSADENGYTAMHGAAAWGRPELLEMLLERDPAAVNVRDTDGDTPLHHVAGEHELDPELMTAVVTVLLDARADPTIENSQGKTCLEACAEIPDEEDAASGAEITVNTCFLKLLADRGFEFQVPDVPGEGGEEDGK